MAKALMAAWYQAQFRARVLKDCHTLRTIWPWYYSEAPQVYCGSLPHHQWQVKVMFRYRGSDCSWTGPWCGKIRNGGHWPMYNVKKAAATEETGRIAVMIAWTTSRRGKVTNNADSGWSCSQRRYLVRQPHRSRIKNGEDDLVQPICPP